MKIKNFSPSFCLRDVLLRNYPAVKSRPLTFKSKHNLQSLICYQWNLVELSPSEKKVAEMKPETEKRSEYEYVYPQTTTISILHTSYQYFYY